MIMTSLSYRGHFLKRSFVERTSSFSGQPGVYGMTSLGIWQGHVVVLTAGPDRLSRKLAIQQLGNLLDRLSPQWRKTL